MHKALGAAALILTLAAAQPAAGASSGKTTLQDMRLRPGATSTQLVLVLEGACPYEVVRDGAAGLTVRLPSCVAAAGLSEVKLSDARVAVALEEGAGELLVRIRAKVSRLGYVRLPTEGGLSLHLFADAPGLEQPVETAAAAKAASPAAAQPKEHEAKQPKATQSRIKEPKAREPAGAAARPKEAAGKPESAEPAEEKAGPEPEQASPSAPAAVPPVRPSGPKSPLRAAPLPLLAQMDSAEPTKPEMADLPGTGPELGGLLPGTEPPRRDRDKLLRQLLSTRESEAAYARALRKLKGGGYDEAAEEFRQAQAAYPKTVAGARAGYRLADCLYALAADQEGREAAIRAYLEAVSRAPLGDEVDRAYLQLGRLYLLGGYDYEAMSYLALVIKEHPDSPYALHAYLHRGDLYFKQGKYKQAEEDYCQVGRRFPNSVKVREANFKLVRTLFASKDYDGVERAYGEMRERWPETFAADPGLLRYIGETYFQQSDYPRCRDFLFYVLNIYPDMTANHLLLGRIGDAYLAEGNRREAAKVYRLLIDTFAGSEGAQFARIRLAEEDLAEGRALVDGLASGEKRLGKLTLYKDIAAGEGPAAQLARFRIGLWHYWRRDYLKAAGELRRMLADEAGLGKQLAADCRYALSEALYRQLRIYFEQERFAEVVQLQAGWGKWMDGQRAETFYYLGESFRRSHLPRDAVRFFLKAQGLPWREDRRQDTLFGLGLARLETGEYAEAANSLRQLVEAYPDYSSRFEALRALGKASYLSGRYQAAAVAIEEALGAKRDPKTRAEDLYLLGLALLGLKDPGRAAAALAESLAACERYECDKLLQAEASLELGNALYGLERWEEAAQAYGQVALMAPGGPEAQQALYKAGKCYVALGRRAEAASAFSQGAAAGEDGIWKKASVHMLEGLQMGKSVP